MNISSDVPTRDNCTMDRDVCIALALEESAPMIANLAQKLGFEAEDCMQEAAIAMFLAWDKIPANHANVKAYLHRCAHNKLINMRKRVKIDALSLDEPIAPDSDETFADVLVAPGPRDTTREDHIADTIHAALSTCMIEEQEYAVHLYGMYAYTPVAPARRRPGLKAHRNIKNRNDATNIKRCMIRVLRKHPQVQALLTRTQHETATL